MVTKHFRVIPPYWFGPLLEGDATCVFVLDDTRPEFRVGDTIVLASQDDHNVARILLRRITHIYNGYDRILGKWRRMVSAERGDALDSPAAAAREK